MTQTPQLSKKQSVLFIVDVLLFVVFFLFAYTLLHEIGHGIIGIISGGKIDKLILGLNARVFISNANYTNFTLPLMNLFGMLLPYLFVLVVMLCYRKSRSSLLYHFIHCMISFGVGFSVLPWLVIPIVSLFGAPPVGDDVTNFLMNSMVHPLIVSAFSIILIGIYILVVLKKGIIQKYISINKAMRKPNTK